MQQGDKGRKGEAASPGRWSGLSTCSLTALPPLPEDAEGLAQECSCLTFHSLPFERCRMLL